MVVDLVPHVVWLGSTIQLRYHAIRRIGDGITEAAAVAISFREGNLALEWLEQGRSIIWGQVLQLRTPIDELRARYPAEADKLISLSHALESAGTADAGGVSQIANADANHSLEDAAQVELVAEGSATFCHAGSGRSGKAEGGSAWQKVAGCCGMYSASLTLI
jgi:hypothetical protein